MSKNCLKELLISCRKISIKGGDIVPNKKQTSKEVAKVASKILRDGRSSAASKKVAGSALSQTKKK